VKVEKEELGDGRPSQIGARDSGCWDPVQNRILLLLLPKSSAAAVIGMFRILKSNWKWGSILK
jgi:hypothetical protein